MTHVIPMCCAILTMINVCKAILPDGKNCPAQLLILSKLNQSATEISLENLENDTITCSCVEQTCQSLCCPKGQPIKNLDCVPVDNRTDLELSKSYVTRKFRRLPGQLQFVEMHVLSLNPCDGSEMVRVTPERYKILANGSTYVPFPGQTVDFLEYCIDDIDGNFVYTSEICVHEEFAIMELMDKIAVAALIISVPCFIVTFVVYSGIPKLNTMHGSTLRGYVGPLAVTYTCIAVVSLEPEMKNKGTLCISVAILIYFSALASFLWLNVMCFNIWWTLGRTVSNRSMPQRSLWKRKKFIIFSSYAWGSALLITAVCLIMDFEPNIPTSLIKPEFGVKCCYFGSKKALALYYYGPVGVMVVVNTLFFASTIMRLVKHQKENGRHLRGKDSQRHDDNMQQFNVHLKLFIVMGINWSLDIASYLFNDSPKYLWLIADLINKLQGVIILVIFVLNKKVQKTIRNHFSPAKNTSHNLTNLRKTSTTKRPRESERMIKNRGSDSTTG